MCNELRSCYLTWVPRTPSPSYCEHLLEILLINHFWSDILWVFVPFFMHFLGRNHIWMWVLSSRSIAVQLSEKSWFAFLSKDFKTLSLGDDHGTFNMPVVSSTSMVIWWLPFWITLVINLKFIGVSYAFCNIYLVF